MSKFKSADDTADLFSIACKTAIEAARDDINNGYTKPVEERDFLKALRVSSADLFIMDNALSEKERKLLYAAAYAAYKFTFAEIK